MMRKYLGFVVTGGMISAAILMFAQVPAYFRAWKTPLVAEQVQIKKERTVTVSQAAAKRVKPAPSSATLKKIPSTRSLTRAISRMKGKRITAGQAEDEIRRLIRNLEDDFDIDIADLEIREGRHSTQVFARQMVEGSPIEPGGRLTLDISRDGTIGDVYSTMVQIQSIDQRAAFSSDALIAQSGLDPASVQSKREIYWMRSHRARTDVVKAYAVIADGVEWIFEAESGKRLSRRDLKHF